MSFLEPARFWWLVALPVLAAVVVVASLRHRRGLHRFATPERLGATLPTRSRARAVARTLLLLGCLALLLVALADPRRGERERAVPPGDHVSVVFALDVSRSMLAQDVSPTRLDRAKQYIRELTAALQDVEDDAAVGLVAFAGAVKRVAPVTRNVNELELALQATDTTSAGVGGSNLADAVQVAARSFVDRRPGHKVVFMLTDGEENTSGEPAAAAKAAFEERGVRFFPLGLGSPDTGATIPLGGGRVMTHQGQAVQTTLDAGALKSVAQEGGGVYVPAETKRADMAEVYRRLIRPRLNAGTTEGDAAAARATTVKALIPRFGWLAWPALLLLVIERLIAAWPARRGVSGPMLGAALLSLSLLPVAAVGQETEPDPRAAYNAAVAAHAAGDAEAAQRGFAEAALRGVGRVEARARYNLARAAHVRAIAAANPGEAPAGAPPDDQAPAGGQAPEADPLALLDEAVREYAAALGADPAFDDARANLEAAARLREQLRQQQQDQQQQEQEQEQEQEQNQEQDQESEESSSDDPSQEQEQEQEPQDSESSEDSGDPQESESESQNQEDGEPSEGGESEPSESEQEQGESESDPADTTAGSEAPEAANQPEGEAEDSAENGEDDQDAEPATPQAAGQAAEGEPQALSPDEAMKLLQRIRDQDLERRIEQYQREAQRQQRVEKDW